MVFSEANEAVFGFTRMPWPILPYPAFDGFLISSYTAVMLHVWVGRSQLSLPITPSGVVLT
jgi:hypothetical protein